MPAGIAKDQLLSTQIVKMINLENNEEQRNLIFQKNISGVENPKFKNLFASQLQVLNNQQKGKVFPNLNFEDADGKAVNLSQFKGK